MWDRCTCTHTIAVFCCLPNPPQGDAQLQMMLRIAVAHVSHERLRALSSLDVNIESRTLEILKVRCGFLLSKLLLLE